MNAFIIALCSSKMWRMYVLIVNHSLSKNLKVIYIIYPKTYLLFVKNFTKITQSRNTSFKITINSFYEL
jgi:hypothetical protein